MKGFFYFGSGSIPINILFFFFLSVLAFANLIFDHFEAFKGDITKAEIKEFMLQFLDRLEDYDAKRVSLITLDETAPVAEMKQMKFDHLPVYCWFLHKFLEKVGRNIEDQDFEEFLHSHHFLNKFVFMVSKLIHRNQLQFSSNLP